MTTDVSLRWAGSLDSTSGSTYKIERTLDNVTWTTLAAGQASTVPYVSPASTLIGAHSWGATSLVLADASSFSASGYGWIDDSLVRWTGKSSNTLTGVSWLSGYGTYATGSSVREAHESYSDSGLSVTNNAVLYRITHIDATGNQSAPLSTWYYAPPAPVSRDHCVVIVALATDLGFDLLDGISVNSAIGDSDQFSDLAGLHLKANGGSNSQTTNAFGLAFFQCWRDSARSDIAGGADANYSFTIDPGGIGVSISAQSIPDRDWVLLPQIA